MNKTIYDYLDSKLDQKPNVILKSHKPKRIQVIHSKSKIKLPDSFSNILTHPNFVENRLNEWWSIYKNDVLIWLEGQLRGEKFKYDWYLGKEEEGNPCKYFSTDFIDPEVGKGKFKSTLRHQLAYSAIPEFTAKKLGFGIWSEGALQVRERLGGNKGCFVDVIKGKVTQDHIIGATPAACASFVEYRDSGWDIHYILHDWLPSQLVNYFEILILKSEHQTDTNSLKEAIKRGDKYFSIEDKRKGLHYTQAEVPLPLVVTNENSQRIV